MARKEIALDVRVNNIDDANDQLNGLESSIDDVRAASKKTTDQMEGGFKAAKGGAEAASKGVSGLGSSIGTLLKSLGILTIAIEVFNYLKNLLMGNQRVADTMSKAFMTVEIVFNRVTVAVQNLISQLRTLSSFSLQDILDAFKTFGKEVSNAGDDALALADKIVRLRNEVKLAEAQQGLLMLQYQKEAEIQRQIRDDISKTISERQEANRKLGEILDEQTRVELANAQKRKELADLELLINRESIDAQVNVINAKKEIVDIEERITGQRSEQLTNMNALKNEEKALYEERQRNFEDATKWVLDPFWSELHSPTIAAIDQLLTEFKTAQDSIREYLKLNNEGITDDQIQHHEMMLRLEESYQKRFTKIQQAEAEMRRQYQINAAVQVAGALGSISDMVLRKSSEDAAAYKTLAIAELAINTGVAISNAIATASKSTNVYEMIGGIAAGVAAVISAIGQAESIINGADVPSAGTSNVASSVSVSSPSFSPVTTNTTELGNTTAAELAPIQAFVVETQLTGTQNNINQIQSQATFGV